MMKQDRSELSDLIKSSVARYNAMAPDQRLQVLDDQRRSWVRGELMLSHPDMTPDEADAIINSIDALHFPR